MRASRLRATLLAAAVTAAALYFLLTDAVVAALAAAVDNADLPRLAAALALVPLIQWLRAWRFGVLISGRLAMPDRDLIGIAALLNMFNFVLPFRIGEASFPIMMKRARGLGFARSTGILILVRLMDLCATTAILFGGAAAIYDAPVHGWSRPAFVGAAAAAAVALLALPASGLIVHDGTTRLLRSMPRALTLLDHLLSGATTLRRPPQQAAMAALTLAIWGLHSLIAFLAATAAVPGLPFPEVMVAGAAANLAFALPISGIAGLGPAQAAWATALRLAGEAWEPAIVSALSGYAVVLAGAVILGAAAYLLRRRRS